MSKKTEYKWECDNPECKHEHWQQEGEKESGVCPECGNDMENRNYREINNNQKENQDEASRNRS